mgnify:CR=1 FL=1
MGCWVPSLFGNTGGSMGCWDPSVIGKHRWMDGVLGSIANMETKGNVGGVGFHSY